MVHAGKKQWWLTGPLAVICAAQLVGGGMLLGVAVIGGEWPALIPAAALLLAGGMILWILRGTSYEITETSLVIRAGPFRWKVPLEAIADVVPVDGWGGSGLEWSFALAIRGLRVRYRKKSGRLTWPIRIAPQDRAAFLLELTERLPELEVGQDGSLRRPAEKAVTG
jgi:hypothetical protein